MLKNRFDYILIWGHGLCYKDEIIDMIGSNTDFEILSIVNHAPNSIEELIKVIYSYDYAPFEHLIAKTEYLKQTPNKVLFIFIINKNANEDFLGENNFRHKESLTLKALKEEIRNRYNPQINNKRSEDHVIYATDNESQTDYILKYLGYKNGVLCLFPKTNIIKAPYHLGTFKKITIKEIELCHLYCSIVKGEINNVFKETLPIEQTPHYSSLTKDTTEYKEYLNKYAGSLLTDYYSEKKFIQLSKQFHYLEPPNEQNYIIVRQIEDKLVIQDGVHRASILMKNGCKKALVAIISYD